MKKLIAMVMTAAMVASVVPATAFAAVDKINATANVVNSWTKKDNFDLDVSGASVPELQLKITDVNYQNTTGDDFKAEVTLNLDGAKFIKDEAALEAGAKIKLNNSVTASGTKDTYSYKEISGDDLLKDYYDAVVAGKTELSIQNLIKATDFPSDGTLVAGGTKIDFDAVKAGGSGALAVSNDPTKSGKTAETNRDDLFTDYKAAKSLTGTYQYIAKYNMNGVTGEGWYNTAAMLEFIPIADVIAWAKTQTSFTDFDEAALSGDSIVSTEKWETFADWKAGETAFAGKLGVDKLAVETKTTTAATGTNRVITFEVKKNAAGQYIGLNDDRDELTFVIKGNLEKGDVISFDLLSVLDKTKSATVSITSDDIKISNDDEDMTYVSIESEGVTASIKKVATVAEEEHTALSKNLVIKSTVEDFADGQVIELKLSNGFEFFKAKETADQNYTLKKVDDDVVNVIFKKDVTGFNNDKIEILASDIEIEATDAKSGATAVITVKATNKNAAGTVLTDGFNARTTVEVMKVVDYTVVLSKDADKDVPTFYNGVNTDNYGLTDDADHWSVEVTAEETFPGAWSFRKGFNFELPDGVFVTDVEIKSVEGFLKTTNTAKDSADVVTKQIMSDAFLKAYQDGDNLNFEFDKRVFDDVDSQLAKDEAKVTFKLQLVADPDFVGDVTLKLTGELVDEQELVIAKFVSPFEITAEQNDLKIDYRYTEVPTTIVVKEAEDGLWDADKAEFGFTVEKPDYIVFEDDPTFTVDNESGMKLSDDKLMKFGGNDYKGIHFTVDKESAEPATVTISDLSLFMQRSIPAGPYDLIGWTSMWNAYEGQVIYGAASDAKCGHTWAQHDNDTVKCNETKFIGDVCDYSDTVKEAFVNVVTAGREQDDASFTTKVVVPVGEKYIIAGEVQYDIDVPAYINANGYTMLPVRAVAVALGINNNNVLWDQATKTVTILYGQRIITMQVGASVVYVNGSAIPASSSVEITDSRTFLGLRDLATALGVTTINWDAATKTASLN